MEETTEVDARSVPWSAREAWLGVIALVLWLAGVFAASYLMGAYGLSVDPGLFTGIAEAALLVPIWWLVMRRYGVGWEALGLRRFQAGNLGVGCGLMIISILFNLSYSAFLAAFDLRMQSDLVPIFAELSSPWWLLLAGIVVAPVVEEIFFRGFLYAGLAGRYSWRKAAVISSGFFAIVHLQPLAIAPIFILGYIFAYLYRRSGSIWPAVVMHVSTNALALGAAYLLSRIDLPV
ncbi:MAG: lysostaphin resistance A-like protein [Anaerolineae bacterium]|jgi:membrane protease YdiL (CAAX protease family)